MYDYALKRCSCHDSEYVVTSPATVTPINELYIPQTNGEISESIMQNWTLQAKECYEINSVCSKCSLSSGNYSFICQMPKIVKALLKAYGPPAQINDNESVI